MVVVAALSLISGLGVLAIFLYTRRTNQAIPYITLLTNQRLFRALVSNSQNPRIQSEVFVVWTGKTHAFLSKSHFILSYTTFTNRSVLKIPYCNYGSVDPISKPVSFKMCVRK
jgi:hypothetical protein